MTPPAKDVATVVHGLCSLPHETEWVEFKLNQSSANDIGTYMSALANSAVLAGEPTAYVVWGIEDETHRIVGTSFDPFTMRIGNELLEGWLNRLLNPRLNFTFRTGEVDGHTIVMLDIPRAITTPVKFNGEAYIRVGSYRKKLGDQPEKERDLWRAFDRTPFEQQIAAESVSDDGVLRLLDYPAYFELLNRPLPEGRSGILHALEAERLITVHGGSRQWSIMNQGALLFAKKFSDFPQLERKAVRVIQYKSNNRVETIKEQLGGKGYASGFPGLISYVNGLIPSNEIVGMALRKAVPMYPELAIRELVVNALIHQDLAITGAGPTVEIFESRMEVTNPGRPVVEPDRFLDTPPRSRNEQLAGLMRRFGICEERGSGIDKVVHEVEAYQLPAPIFEIAGEGMRAVLFAHRPLSQMEKRDRVRACYQHACLKYVTHEHMTNSSVRHRFGIADQNIAQASRLIKESVEAGQIQPYDRDAAPRQMRYVPWWAADQST